MEQLSLIIIFTIYLSHHAVNQINQVIDQHRVAFPKTNLLLCMYVVLFQPVLEFPLFLQSVIIVLRGLKPITSDKVRFNQKRILGEHNINIFEILRISGNTKVILFLGQKDHCICTKYLVFLLFVSYRSTTFILPIMT